MKSKARAREGEHYTTEVGKDLGQLLTLRPSDRPGSELKLFPPHTVIVSFSRSFPLIAFSVANDKSSFADLGKCMPHPRLLHSLPRSIAGHRHMTNTKRHPLCYFPNNLKVTF
jgi:hypothetical protein